MRRLEERILRDGKILSSTVLKVDSFLNHQIDPELMKEIGGTFAQRFREKAVTKVVTLESSGIAPAAMTALELGVPAVFARKRKSLTLADDLYSAEVYSYTKEERNSISISKDFLSAEDRVLLIDDFLANGQAVLGLSEIVKQADATLAGVGIVIEKGFQDGGHILREKGIHIESLAIIDSLSGQKIRFQKEDVTV
ncbi:xanthine phosphoribosyltransferase [Virgibacillus sp. MSP4-1]|uniref:xanthine phosphoribosyltransferase n=1 Tax=Virgibacillus sp. MSP4-1 TaxID=2700081 RepID=UPI0003A50F2B|nr:xanthine phosphoribosyltransferase [Virgibacillus sp. MSP4-1]QHS21872.1 xanthine phosphoribosyltransferase [Virgibacillus sp. MSP4-1]